MERQRQSAYFLMAISALRIASVETERTGHAAIRPARFITQAKIGTSDAGSQQPFRCHHPPGCSLCVCRRYSDSGRLASALRRTVSDTSSTTRHQQHEGLQGSWAVDTPSRTHILQRRVSPSAAITMAGGSCTTGWAGSADCLPAKLRPCTLPMKKATTTRAPCAVHRPANASNSTACRHQRPKRRGTPLRGATPELLGRALSPAVCAPFSIG